MGITNLSFSATNLNVGLDADKPTAFLAGAIYVATDTESTYRAYSNNVWTKDTSDFMEQEYLSIGMVM